MPKTPKPIEFAARLECASNGSGWHYITVEKEIGERFERRGNSRRVICTLNGTRTFPCALMPNRGSFLIMVNKAARTALGIAPGSLLKVSLAADTSKYGLPMPEEFEEVLRQDPEGSRLFHALTPGRQRSLIYGVSSGKDIDLRIHRSLIILRHLKENDGKVNGEMLYREMRRPII